MKIVAFAILLIFAAGDMSLEEESELTLRQQFAKMKAEMKAMKAEMKTQRSCSMPDGALLIFVDGRTTCPKGYAEPNTTQGMMFVGRPKNATSGAVFNRPLDAGELGRSPAHTHAVTVNDPGHTHVAAVNDPGHYHGYVSGICISLKDSKYHNQPDAPCAMMFNSLLQPHILTLAGCCGCSM